MSNSKVLSKTVGPCLTQYYREDVSEMIPKFRQFAHFSQFSDVSRSTTKLPVGSDKSMNMEVRIDSSPEVLPGERLFGVNLDGSLLWLSEIIDSSG